MLECSKCEILWDQKWKRKITEKPSNLRNKRMKIQARGGSTCKGRNKILPQKEEELSVMRGEAKMVN